jgi:hypothetical protein
MSASGLLLRIDEVPLPSSLQAHANGLDDARRAKMEDFVYMIRVLEDEIRHVKVVSARAQRGQRPLWRCTHLTGRKRGFDRQE